MSTEPLQLPENFNPQTNLLAKTTENGTFHESRAGARLAERLLENGHSDDITQAIKTLEATLACQETHPDDPHYGNFYWMAEDDVVGDLNAVEFCLESLIPMMLDHGNRLPQDMQQRVLNAIRLGLDEIRRINVRVTYSNITALDILNSCLGGELLNDRAIAQRGYDKLVEWMAYTDRNGTPREFNSPTYIGVFINAFKRLSDHVQHKPTQVRARTMAARLAFSVGLHIHKSTGRWSGPHSRAYHPSVVCEAPAEINRVNQWFDSGALPKWANDVLNYPTPIDVIETADAELKSSLTTHQSDSFCLGTATRQYGGQSDVLMAHYTRDGADRPGVLYTRYLLNDKWLGDFYHATDRTKSRNLVDEGQFRGVQHGPRAIGLYTPQSIGNITSAKACFIFTQREHIDEIWVGDQQITALPVEVPENQTITIASGTTLFAIRPLSRTDIGRNAPIRLVDKQGDLVLETYNYLGSEKSFWEMRPDGPFFQGHPKNGIYIEMAERADYPNAQTFGQTVASGTLRDKADSLTVYDGQTPRNWVVEYERNGQKIGIEIDLMQWDLKRRWTHEGELDFPMLTAPIVHQSRTGRIDIGDASFTFEKGAGWLYNSPNQELYIAGYHGPNPSPITLTLPNGKVEIESLTCGTIIWQNGNVTVDALDLKNAPQVTGGQLVSEIKV